MKLYEPCFAAQFHCLAGACPDTCCKDWEIILDEKTLARYRALPGVFGDEVRNALTTDAEGDTMFRLTDGHCPLLSSDGLCRVQLSLGEEALCDTCRAHPRFYEEYGAAKELTLSISCPAAIDLLFAQETPIKFVCREDGAPVSGCNDLDPDRYFALRRARDTAISIVQSRSLSISGRLSLLLLFAVKRGKRGERLQISRILAGEQCRNAEHVEQAAFRLRKHLSVDACLEKIAPEKIDRQVLPLRGKIRVKHVLRALH